MTKRYEKIQGRALGAAVRLRDRLRDERGQALLEYALIISFVAVACVAALTFRIPGYVTGVFTEVSSKLP